MSGRCLGCSSAIGELEQYVKGAGPYCADCARRLHEAKELEQRRLYDVLVGGLVNGDLRPFVEMIEKTPSLPRHTMTGERELKPWRDEPNHSVYVDREGWPPGPWDDEPDRIEFEHAGLPCLIVRVDLGSWCGYVAVPPGHPWHGRGYDHVDAEAHGGLTYSGPSQVGGLICHASKAGATDDVWWLGFDCAHAGDLMPGMFKLIKVAYDWDTYRDQVYVMAGVRHLAKQARAATTA